MYTLIWSVNGREYKEYFEEKREAYEELRVLKEKGVFGWVELND